MGRAERILVFAVFGVIALILGITAFLPEQAAGKDKDKETAKVPGGQTGNGQTGNNKAPPAGNAGGLTPVERLLQADQEPPATTGAEGKPGGDGRDGKAADAGKNAAGTNGTAPTGSPGAAVRFGVQHPGNPNYLMVKVRPGDTFGQIVERECGSLQHYLEQAIALNEAIEPGNIHAGQELILPFVPEDQLPRRVVKSEPLALQGNAETNLGKDAVVTPVNATFANPATELERRPLPVDKSLENKGTDKKSVAKEKSGGAGLAANSLAGSYTVKRGDTLWALAEKKWGRSKAKSKVQEILALNTGTLKSDSDLRAGQVIRLP